MLEIYSNVEPACYHCQNTEKEREENTVKEVMWQYSSNYFVQTTVNCPI